MMDLEKRFKDVKIDFWETGSGRYSLHKIIVPKGQRGRGIGTKIMKEITEIADRNCKQIVLSPATDFGGSSEARLINFYKQFGFVENKGRNIDYTISDTMYRNPKCKKFNK